MPPRAAALLVLVLAALPARAESPPACSPDRLGSVACIAGKLCLCGYQRGGVLAGRPEGYLWDCGVLRPACGAPPATLPGAPLPPFDLLLPAPPGLSPWRR
jgi:hypothetical protein